MRLAALLLLGSAFASAHAQSAITVGWPAPGSHIRVESATSGRRQFGTLISANNDSIVFQPEGLDFGVALETSDVVKMDVSRGSDRHVWMGIGLGFVLAGGTVALAVAKTWHPSDGIDFGRWGDAAILGVPAGLLGGIIGGVIGAIPMDKWVRVVIPRR